MPGEVLGLSGNPSSLAVVVVFCWVWCRSRCSG